MCVHAQSLSHVWLSVTLWTIACQAPLSMGFSRQEYWSGLPLIVPTQGSNLGLLHYRQILYHLSHQGSLNSHQKLVVPWRHHSKQWTNRRRTNTIWFHVSEVPKESKFLETESGGVGARGWRRGSRELLSSGDWVWVWEDEKALETWWWLHITVKVLNATEMYTQKLTWWISCDIYFRKIKQSVLTLLRQ